MTVFALFFAELMTMRYGNFGGAHDHAHDTELAKTSHDTPSPEGVDRKLYQDDDSIPVDDSSKHNPHARGEDHLGHSRDHRANETLPADWETSGFLPESYAAQMTAIFILEFGVIFHSVFIGLTLAVAGEEFITRKQLLF